MSLARKVAIAAGVSFVLSLAGHKLLSSCPGCPDVTATVTPPSVPAAAPVVAPTLATHEQPLQPHGQHSEEPPKLPQPVKYEPNWEELDGLHQQRLDLSKLAFEDIVVINRQAREDRKRKMVRIGDYLGLSFSFFLAYEAHEITHMPPEASLRLTPNEYAVVMSHREVLKRFALGDGHDDDAILVLEDDVDLELDFTAGVARALFTLQRYYEKFQRGKPGDNGVVYDMLYLGNCIPQAKKNDKGKYENQISEYGHLYTAPFPQCAHAYAVTRRAARRLAHPDFEHVLGDPGVSLDLMYVSEVLNGRLKAYAVEPNLARQESEGEVLSDVYTDQRNRAHLQAVSKLRQSVLERLEILDKGF